MRLKKYYLYKPSRFTAIVLIKFLSALFTITVSYLFYLTVTLATNDQFERLVYLGIGAIPYFIILSALSFLNDYYTDVYVYSITEKLRIDVFESILKTDYTTFNQRTSGEYLTMLQEDVERITRENFIRFFDIIGYVFTLLLGIIYAFFFSWIMALILICLASIVFLTPIFLAKYVLKASSLYSEAIGEYSKYIDSYLNGTNIIRNCEAIHRVCCNALKYHEKALNSNNRLWTTIVRYNETSNFTMYLFYFGLIFIVCVLVFFDYSTIATAVAFLTIHDIIILPIQMLYGHIIIMKQTRGIIDKIFSFKVDKNFDKKTIINKPAISLENITVGFDDRILLKNTNYNFDFGKKYLIVGESGIGKTSLLNMLMGYHEQKDGTVIFVGDKNINIKDANTDSLIGFVHQQPYLFIGSLKDNITIFDDNPDMEKINKVIKQCQLEEFVSKRGLDSLLDNNTNAISLGEMQRICLARILYLDRPILFLDEITSSVDTENTRKIYQTISSIKDKLIIWISHEQETRKLNRIDHTLKIENERLIEI